MSASLTAKCKGQTLAGKQCSRMIECNQGQYCWQHQSKATPVVKQKITPVVAKFPVDVSSAELGKMSAYVKPPGTGCSMNGKVIYTYDHAIDQTKPVIIFVDNEGNRLQSIEVNGMMIPIEKYINIGLVGDKIGVRAWVVDEYGDNQTAYPFTFNIDTHDADDGGGGHEVDGYYSQNDDYPDVDFAYIAGAKTTVTIGPKYNLLNITMTGGGG